MISIIVDGFLGNLIVFVLGAIIMLRISHAVGTSAPRGIAIYLWHSAFAIFYIQFILNANAADALTYFARGTAGEFEIKPGSGFINAVTALLSNGFGLTLTGVTLVFAMAGAIGLLLIDSAILRVTLTKSPAIRNLASYIVFLPSASFWSVGLGKDSIAMMASGIFVFSALPGTRMLSLLSGAVLTMFLVRPHIAVLMIAATVIAIAVGSRISWSRRIIIGGVALGVVAVAIPFVLTYVGLDEAPSQMAIEEYVEQRQSMNMGGGSSVELTSMNPVQRVFTYMFRPTILEINSIFSLVSAVENFLLILLFTLSLLSFVLGSKYRTYSVNSTILVLFSVIALVVLSQTTANIGIAVRQKWMLLPMFLILSMQMLPDWSRPRPLYRR